MNDKIRLEAEGPGSEMVSRTLAFVGNFYCDIDREKVLCHYCKAVVGELIAADGVVRISSDCGCQGVSKVAEAKIFASICEAPAPEAPDRHLAKPRKTWDAGRLFQGRGR